MLTHGFTEGNPLSRAKSDVVCATPSKAALTANSSPLIPCRIYRAQSSHPHGEAILEPGGQPAAADLFPPTAVFEVAVRGEIPRHPRPILQPSLVPASSHAGLSSPPIPLRSPSLSRALLHAGQLRSWVLAQGDPAEPHPASGCCGGGVPSMALIPPSL